MGRVVDFPRRNEASTSAAFQEAIATLDRLEALMGKVEPLVEGLEGAEAREALRDKMACAKLELDAARRNAMLLEGILPV